MDLAPPLDPLAAAWLGADTSSASAAAWWALQQRRVHDLAWAERFAASCPVAGAEARHYLQATLSGPEGEALVGVRFLGGDVGQPFVDLLAWQGPLRPWLGRALRHYAPLSPQLVRVRTPGTRSPDAGATVDQWVVAGRPAVPEAGDVVAVADPDEALAFVADAQQDWVAAEPWMEGRVVPMEGDDAVGAAEEGALWWIVADGQRAGVLATRWATDREWTGWCVVEQIVARPFTGRGLAAGAQRAAAARQRPGVWFGTIDGANTASLRTAEASGRIRVGGWWWVDPAPGR